MDIVITQWALDAYLNLKSNQVFSASEYWNSIRPDVLLLKGYPNDVRFKQPKFWSVAQCGNGKVISDGFKMKWHQVGPGRIQLRLPVGVFSEAILCAAYVKQQPKQELRQLAKFKTYLQLIRQNHYTVCGRIS